MSVDVFVGDCREVLAGLPDKIAHTCVTSPPYFGLRDYDHADQIGLEPTPGAFVAELVAVFREVRRVLRDDGTLWLNLGDSYAGSWGAQSRGSDTPGLKAKDLIGIPWRVAFALQADGWYLRQDIIWSKPNPMPESVEDRCTKAHEYVFLLSKSERYFYDAAAIAEPATWTAESGRADVDQGGFAGKGKPARGQAPFRAIKEARNKRSVWTVASQPFRGAHFAVYPPALIEPCILAGAPSGGVVLDPFGGAGTTGLVAERLGRSAILIELNPDNVTLAAERIAAEATLTTRVERVAAE